MSTILFAYVIFTYDSYLVLERKLLRENRTVYVYLPEKQRYT